MKRKFVLIFVLLISLAAFQGCSTAAETNQEKAAKNFITVFYNMDWEKSQQILLSTDKLVSSADNFKGIMTDDAIRDIMSDKWYMRNLEFSANERCSMKIKSIKLTKKSYDEKGKKIEFNYTAKIQLTYYNNKKEIDEEEGDIALQEENNQWKVYSNTLTVTSDTFKGLFN